MLDTHLLTLEPDAKRIDDTIQHDIRRLTTDSAPTDAEVEQTLRRVVGWLNRHGHVTASLELLDVVREARLTGERTPDRLSTTVFRLRGISNRLAGNFMAAADDLMKSKVFAELTGDEIDVARALNSLGNVYGSLSHWSIAESCFRQAIEIARRTGHDEVLRFGHQNLVVALYRAGAVRDALRALRESGQTVDPGDDAGGHFAVSRLLASSIVCRLSGFRSTSARLAAQALDAARTRGYAHAEAIAHGVIGELALDRGDHREALTRFRSKVRIAQEIAPDGDLACEAYRGVAEAYLHRGEFDRCERALTEAWRLSCELHDAYERVSLLGLRASLSLERGEREAADRQFREAARLAAKSGFRLAEAVMLERQGFGLLSRGAREAADRPLGEAARIYSSLGLARHATRLSRSRRALSRPWPTRRARRSAGDRVWDEHDLVTSDPAFIRVLEHARRTAASPLPVLITGESGVGKELVARAVHAMSARAGHLVDINCPAIPESMLESELFGCTRGAFTGASDRTGLIAGADRGTLFLDEIGDMPRGLQAKLLRFLETSTYRRLGSGAVDRVDARLVSATNADLEDDASFRRDLYHRIAGIVIEIPPLRDRRGDVAMLARRFARLVAAQQGREAPALDPSLLEHLEAHDWPGNVRELKHLIECMVWSRPDARCLDLDALPDRFSARRGLAPVGDDEIRRAVAASGGSVAGAARELGISRQKLYRRAAELEVDLAALRAS